MLPLTRGDLHFGHDVPVGFRATYEIACGEKFNRWGPLAAEPVISRDGLPKGCVPEEALRAFLCIEGQIGAHLKLHPGVALEELIESGERLEGGGACASKLRASGRRQDSALEDEDGHE